MPTNHGSIEFLKFPDPLHPGDNTRLIKKWLRDSWARRKIAALQTVETGSISSTNANLTITSQTVKKCNNVVTFDCKATATGAINAWSNCFNFESGFRPSATMNVVGIIGSNTNAVRVQFGTGGNGSFGKALVSGNEIFFSGAFIVN